MEKKSKIESNEMKNLIKKILVRFSFLPVILALLTFLPAGTFNYWQVYVYNAVLIIPMIFVLLYFLKNDPEFLERRTRVKEKEKTQIIIQIIFSIIFLSGFVVSGLDRRYGWSYIPFQIILVTDVIILAGYLLIFLVFKQNKYASRIIEVDTGQKVISTGLYGIVRHPMYLGVLIMYLPTPVALGSYWGLIPMATITFTLVFRILNEETVLKRELHGYEEYCKKTKYRLIPYIW